MSDTDDPPPDLADPPTDPDDNEFWSSYWDGVEDYTPGDVWELGGGFSGDRNEDQVRRIVDAAVREALLEYVKKGSLSIDYRKGGSPTITFSTDLIETSSATDYTVTYQDDLGDLLLQARSEWEDYDDHPMAQLLDALLKTYNEWRINRTLTDPRSAIPEPSLLLDRDGADD
jgi:hypothetical protein